MCRWIAYQGPPLRLETLLFQPENALVRQSIAARRGITPVNGDGFGVAWWGDRPTPGLYRDTLPAWNDQNLLSLSEQLAARQFFAHVRASTGTATSRANCHPFAAGRVAFMHNGQIGEWARVRRAVEAMIPDDLYRYRHGSTDTEALFLLAMAKGLADDPAAALARAVGEVLNVMEQAGVEAPFRMTAAAGDGERTTVARWSSDGRSPSLYYATGAALACEQGELVMRAGGGAAVVLSEPLDERDWWAEAPDASALTVQGSDVRVEPFRPIR